MKVVIIGGVAGGATAAARIRRLDEQAEIVVFERSGYISYANCGLPYYIGGTIADAEALTLQTPERFDARFRVDMRVHHEVTAIHPETKTVSVRNLTTGEEFEESYDKLLLSPGAKPTQPRLPGVGLEKLFTLRTVEDTLAIRDYIHRHHPKSAVLAGGGFISLEVAENLRELGMKATDLKDLDLAYSPPYSSAKDPVNMAGFMIDNIERGVVKQWYLEDADTLPRDGSVTLLDSRTEEEYAAGHMDGFRNIPVDELRARLDELDKSRPVYVICQSGLRSYIAARILMGNGFDCYNFAGGFRFYDAVRNDRCLMERATACGMDQ